MKSFIIDPVEATDSCRIAESEVTDFLNAFLLRCGEEKMKYYMAGTETRPGLCTLAKCPLLFLF